MNYKKNNFEYEVYKNIVQVYLTDYLSLFIRKIKFKYLYQKDIETKKTFFTINEYFFSQYSDEIICLGPRTYECLPKDEFVFIMEDKKEFGSFILQIIENYEYVTILKKEPNSEILSSQLKCKEISFADLFMDQILTEHALVFMLLSKKYQACFLLLTEKILLQMGPNTLKRTLIYETYLYMLLIFGFQHIDSINNYIFILLRIGDHTLPKLTTIQLSIHAKFLNFINVYSEYDKNLSPDNWLVFVGLGNNTNFLDFLHKVAEKKEVEKKEEEEEEEEEEKEEEKE